MTIKKDKVHGFIYMIVNTINDKPYIGKTVDINKRMNRHRYNARIIDVKMYHVIEFMGRHFKLGEEIEVD